VKANASIRKPEEREPNEINTPVPAAVVNSIRDEKILGIRAGSKPIE